MSKSDCDFSCGLHSASAATKSDNLHSGNMWSQNLKGKCSQLEEKNGASVALQTQGRSRPQAVNPSINQRMSEILVALCTSGVDKCMHGWAAAAYRATNLACWFATGLYSSGYWNVSDIDALTVKGDFNGCMKTAPCKQSLTGWL